MAEVVQNRRTRLLLILCLALLMRSLGILSRPIWYDEAFSILLSEQAPAAILSGTISSDADASAAEEHPPAYYILLWGWMEFFDSSVTACRIFSILASLVVIIYVFRITNQLFDESTALVAALFVAILPFQIHYAQEIRMYILMALWLSAATDAYLRRQWIRFALFAAMAQYTHTLSFLYLITLALTPVLQKDWKVFRELGLSAGAAMILYLPWLVQLPAQISKVTANYWVDKPGLEKLLALFLFYLPHLPLPPWQLIIGLLSATLTIALAVMQTLRSRNESGSFQHKGIWLAYLAFVPAGLLWVISQFYPVYIERSLLASHAAFCIWLAWVLTKTLMPRPIQRFSIAIIGLCAILGLYQHITYNGFPYGPYKEISHYLAGEVTDGDVIVHSSKLSYLPLYYFNKELPQCYIMDPAGSRTDTLSPNTRKVLNLSGVESIDKIPAATRVWFVIYDQSNEEYQYIGHAAHPHLEYLEENFYLVSTQQWNDIQIHLFSQATK